MSLRHAQKLNCSNLVRKGMWESNLTKIKFWEWELQNFLRPSVWEVCSRFSKVTSEPLSSSSICLQLQLDGYPGALRMNADLPTYCGSQSNFCFFCHLLPRRTFLPTLSVKAYIVSFLSFALGQNFFFSVPPVWPSVIHHGEVGPFDAPLFVERRL